MKKNIVLLSVSALVFALAPIAQADSITTPGDGYTGAYRLAFVTSGSTTPDSTDIGDYNTFVTAAAAAVKELKALGATWKVIGSTAAVSAKVNTSTDRTGGANDVPIYTTTGLRIANNNADLWDGTILNPIWFDDGTEAGVQGTVQEQTWTGTNADGTSASSGEGRELGSGPSPNNIRLVRGGHTDGNWISGPSDHDASAKHLLALSSVIGPKTVRMADTYPLEGKVGISRTWTNRRGSRVVARLVSAQGNRVVLATPEQKTVTIAFTELVKSDQLYLVTPLVSALAPTAQAAGITTPGDGYAGAYRLIFSTVGGYDAISTDIATYNVRVQDEADATSGDTIDLSTITGWKMIGSTVGMNARVNTDTVGSGGANDVPIYNVNGVRVADGNAALWGTTMGERSSEPPYYIPNADSHLAHIDHINGASQSFGNRTWTGTNPDGTTLTGNELGAAQVGQADNRRLDSAWVTWPTTGNPNPNTHKYLHYALSPVLKARGPTTASQRSISRPSEDFALFLDEIRISSPRLEDGEILELAGTRFATRIVKKRGAPWVAFKSERTGRVYGPFAMRKGTVRLGGLGLKLQPL